MNLVMWHLESLQECEKHDIYNAAGTDTFSAHQRVLYLLGPDEPDAHDNRGGGHYNGLGATARELAHSSCLMVNHEWDHSTTELVRLRPAG